MLPLFMKSYGSVQEIELEKADLRTLLHKGMAGYEKARDHSRVHASDVTKKEFCAREFALCDLLKKKPAGSFVGTSLRATYDLGTSLQDMLNQSWGVAWCIGTWECQHCARAYSFQVHPKKCKTCGHEFFFYREEVFIHPEYKHSCSIDYLFFKTEKQLIELVEVKTMVKDEFKTLHAPVAEHRARTAMYLRMIEDVNDARTKKIETQRGRILYICKGFGCAAPDLKEQGIKDAGFSPFKEFIVERSEATDKLTEDYYEKAARVQVFREHGIMPPGYCSTSTCSRAKYCPVRQECWGGEYGSVFGDEKYYKKEK